MARKSLAPRLISLPCIDGLAALVGVEVNEIHYQAQVPTLQREITSDCCNLTQGAQSSNSLDENIAKLLERALHRHLRPQLDHAVRRNREKIRRVGGLFRHGDEQVVLP